MKNLPFLLALHSVEGLGPARLKSLLDKYSDPAVIWNSSDLQGLPELVLHNISKARKEIDPEEYFKKIQKAGIKVITFFDPEYPELLKEISDPPLIIYFKGLIKAKESRSLGVVGTRKVTGYGRGVTEDFTRGLVDSGFTIVSGLARGVDTVAHRTTLDIGGRTIAVLGGGLFKVFPPENEKLAAEIVDSGGLIMTEFPPAYPSLPGNFPARNRIISGLSLGVLVTEAAEDSGSLITARLALEQGREVFAIPGPITSDLSAGPASLIKEGAKLVTSVEDILSELGLESGPVVEREKLELTEVENQILEVLKNETKHIDEICRELGQGSPLVSGTLIKLEIMGVVKNLGGGNYVAFRF